MSAPRHASPGVTEFPSRRDLRARMFWIARWLFGGGEYHYGSIQVVIGESAPRGGDKLVIRPKPGEEVYAADDGLDGTDQMAAIAPKLLATYLTPDAQAVMQFIAAKGAAPAKVIPTGSRVDRTKCYAILCDLRERGLIRDAGEGYEIAAPDVWDVISQR